MTAKFKGLFAVAISVVIVAFAGAQAENSPTLPSTAGAMSEMVLGAEDAPVTLIEYASVTCSHCAHWHEEVFPRLSKDYIDTGKVRFILREMPVIPSHPALVARSYAGSMLARCAADKGGTESYFAVMHALFEGQEEWAFGEDPKSELLKISAESGIDEAGFNACLERADIKAHIDENIKIATDEFAIQGTPGFIINGRYERFNAYEDIFAALDAAAQTKAQTEANAGE